MKRVIGSMALTTAEYARVMPEVVRQGRRLRLLLCLSVSAAVTVLVMIYNSQLSLLVLGLPLARTELWMAGAFLALRLFSEPLCDVITRQDAVAPPQDWVAAGCAGAN